jgi:hypothetical protein
MRLNMVGAFIRNRPFGTEIAFAKGLRELGVEVNEVDPGYPDQSFLGEPDATIVFKYLEPGPSGYRDALVEVNGPKIVYQPDDVAFPHIQQMMREMRQYCEYAFMYDDRGVAFAESLEFKKSKQLLLTADPILYHPKDFPKTVDLCFVGSLTLGANHAGRRRMIDVLKATNEFRIGVASELFDIERINNIYNYSKVVLNHATDVGQPFGHGFGLQCRHFEAGMAGACVLSNVVDNDSSLVGFDTFSSEEELVSKARALVTDDDLRDAFADTLYENILDHHLPVHRAQEIVNFVKGLV